MRDAFATALGRVDDRSQRLAAHITGGLKSPKAFRRPDQPAAAALRHRDPALLAETAIATVCDAIALGWGWHETSEALAAAVGLESDDRVAQIRAGNLLLNLCLEALPDLFVLRAYRDKRGRAYHVPELAPGAVPPLLAIRRASNPLPSTEPPKP
jgi:hypothetical protein